MENRFTFFNLFYLTGHKRFNDNRASLTIYEFYLKTLPAAMYHGHCSNILPN